METMQCKAEPQALFDKVQWIDPVDGSKLEAVVLARNPSGVPIAGALRRPGTNVGYPIVDSVVRLTPELAHRYQDWLKVMNLEPPKIDNSVNFQNESTVDSFGFQWTWNSEMRNENDLKWRVASRFQVEPDSFKNRLVMDAGAGAGDQSSWLMKEGASVVSVDLSAAIEVVSRKLRKHSNWVGVQADITKLPFAANQFECVYCEGVIQHTHDSFETVKELTRVTEINGRILATHYGKSVRLLGRLKSRFMGYLRIKLSKWDRYKLLLFTGIVAALSYIPLFGRLLRVTGIAIYYPMMSDFKTTWTNTFDNYGNHSFQRYASPEEFWGYFQATDCCEKEFSEVTVLRVRKTKDMDLKNTTISRAA